MKQSWQTKRTQPSHADDWLITYADMITLLLCFFAIFLIVSSNKKHTPEKPVTPVVVTATVETSPPPKPEIQTEKPVPDVFPSNLKFHQIGPDDFAVTDATPAEIPEPKPQEPTAAPPVPETPVVKAEIAPPPPAKPTPAPQVAEQPAPPHDAAFEQMGDRITTLEINSAAFFSSGSASLSAEGKTILQNVALNLKGEQFKDYNITVEGHTDDSPIGTAQFPSNWELSTSRAAAVVHFLLDQGLPATKLRAVGYADTLPKLPNRDASGNPIPANQLQNRRVVIKLEKIDKAITP